MTDGPGAPAGITVGGYSHVAVDVTDLDAALAFYCGVFGFREIPRPDFGFPGAWLVVGDLQLHLAVTETPPVRGGFPHFALYVPTEAFAATVAALRDAGVEFLGEPASRVDFGTTTVWAAFVRDPSGNVIELTDVGPGAG
ncbi:MAG TPA: VOC family protein [Acidimicrobiales bacterium]|nr:VOC family protein [Acidimicrobiales bacterium]